MNLKPVAFSNMNQRMKNPVIFLLFSVVLQIILLFINIGSYNIISEELTYPMKVISRNLFTAEIALLSLLSIIPITLQIFRKKISVIIQLVLLILPVIYLFFFTVNIDKVIPWHVRSWIMPVERIIFYQFIFIMPVIFYSIVRIASFHSKFSIRQEMFMSVILLAGPPFLIYFLYNLLFAFLETKDNINHYILPIFLIIATAIMLFAVIRLVLMLYHLFANRSKPVESIVCFIIGLVMPLGGLILNKFIQFPADFQSIPVYILAVLNGIFLTVPDVNYKRIKYIAAIIRLILFPFTLYFFFVFLPFLPLSIPAILAFGAGFLILTPVLLFILHLRRLITDFKKYFCSLSLKQLTAIAAVSLLVIPCIITISGIMDKVSINQAMTYVYEPDYSKANKFNGSRWFVKHGLESLESKKAGIYLPFISGFYDWLVFDNLVLPDYKMNYMYKTFFGRDLKQSRRHDSPFSQLLGSTNNERIQSINRDFTSSRDVVISEISHSSKHNNNLISTNIKIQMKNLTVLQQEFRTSISIPEGVFVSNYWLHVGDKRVPGRIFEKKTAMWIYQMIRSESRDPGLLFYKNPDLLYLFVFPFSGMEKRVTEIELLYPEDISPEIIIGRKKIKLNEQNALKSNIIVFQSKDNLSLLLPEKLKKELPRSTRLPYLHFVVDWSQNSRFANEDILKKIKEILQKFPDIKYCSVSLANYEIAHISGGVVPVQDLNYIDMQKISRTITSRGGFCRDRAIRNILLNYNMELKNATLDKRHFFYFPIIFVIKDPDSMLLTEDNSYYFSKLLPDIKYLYSYEDTNTCIINFNGVVNRRIKKITPEQIIIVKAADNIISMSPDKNDIIHNKSTDIFLHLEVYNPLSGQFQPSPVKYYYNKCYGKAMHADMLCREKILNPSLSRDLFKPIVAMSKETGILNQLTSYIVVENSAQWNMLKMKEKNKLKNKESMEIVNTPEPSVIIIAGLFILFLILQAVRIKIKLNY